MGYISWWTEELTLNPPVPYGKIKESKFYQGSEANRQADPAVVFDVTEYPEETDRGTLTVREAVAIIPSYEDGMKAYSIMAELQELLDLLPEGTEVTGYLAGRGSDRDDLSRIYVKRHDAIAGGGYYPVRVRAKIHWPLAAVGVADQDEWQISSRGQD
jgi:hypothetical protein